MDLDETWQVGLRAEKAKPCTFTAKWVESAKNGSQRRCFLWREPRTTSATFLGSISAKLSTNTCPRAGSRHMVSYCRKVSNKGSNLPKNPLLEYLICDQATGHGKRSATPTLFPYPSGHPTDVPFLGDFCWRMYRFAAIHLRKCPYQQCPYLDGDSRRATWREARH